MDSSLFFVHGQRLENLKQPDLPRVAQAIVDAEYKIAQVGRGFTQGVGYIEIIRPGHYSVVVRSDDWALVVPFLRNSGGAFTPVILPETQPDPILSNQPNAVTQPPIPSPWGDSTSFVEGLPYATARQIEGLLTQDKVSVPVADYSFGKSTSQSYPKQQFYTRILTLLQQLFPTIYPTSY